MSAIGDPLSQFTFKKSVPVPVQEVKQEQKTLDNLLADQKAFINANPAIYYNSPPSETVLAEKMKGASYLEATLPPPKMVFSEREFKTMHPFCAALENRPLSIDELKLLHENYRREGTCRRALDFVIQIITGKRTDIEMAPTKGFSNAEREEEEIEILNDDPENIGLLDELATIDRNVGFNDRMREMMISGKNFGRSVLVKQYDEFGIPIRLIPLASMKLGKVYIDSETWEFIGVEYLDYQGERRILRAEDIIHYENADYHITPGSRYFGMSALEPVMHIAQAIRVLEDIAIPEIGKGMWAPALDVYVPKVQSQQKMDLISANILPNKRWVHNYEAVIKTIDTKADLKSLVESLVELTKIIFRTVGVPLVVAYQDEQNRATAQAAVNICEATMAEYERTKLRNVLEPQWYIPNLLAVIRKRQAKRTQGAKPLPGIEAERKPTSEEVLKSQYQDIGVLNALERSNRILELDASSNSIVGTVGIGGFALPFYPKMVFRPLSIDTFLERTAATLAWVNAGALTVPMGLEVGGLPQYKEEMEEYIKQKEAEQKELMQMQIAAGIKIKQQSGNKPNSISDTAQDESKRRRNPNLIAKSAIQNFPVSTRQETNPSDLLPS